MGAVGAPVGSGFGSDVPEVSSTRERHFSNGLGAAAGTAEGVSLDCNSRLNPLFLPDMTEQATASAGGHAGIRTYDYSIWQVIAASSAGTVIEWYDFYIFGSLAAIISPLFYPPGNDV